MTTVPAPEETWLGLEEAASILGLSVSTLRRQRRKGELQGRQVATPYGSKWLVLLPPRPAAGAQGGRHVTGGRTRGHDAPRVLPEGDVAQGEQAGLVEALHLIRTLQEENRNLAGQLGYLQRQVHEQQAAIRALQAPSAPAETAHTPESAQEGQERSAPPEVAQDDVAGSSTPARRAWWRFW